MKRNLLLVGLWLLGALPAGSNDNAPSETIAIAHVTVIDATGAPAKRDQTVLIEGDRIAAMGPSSNTVPPPTAQIVDGWELYLIPGLWDMHVHIWDADLALPLFLANGVTGVRNTGGHPDELKRWRQELSEGKRLGPRLVACGPVVDGDPPIHPDHSVVVHNAAEASDVVDRLQTNGWDCIKVYDNLPRDAYLSVAAEAKARHIPLVGHVPLSVTASEASNSGQKSIEHLDGLDYAISPLGEQFRQARLARIGKPLQPGEMMKLPLRIADEINELADTYDETRASNLFTLLKRNQTWQVPTLSVARAFASVGSRSMYQDSRLRYVSAEERGSWQNNPIVHIDLPEYVAARKRAFQQALRMTRAAHQQGVRFLAGTDSGGVPYLYYGSSLHDELALLVQAGFTPMEALESATRDPAQFLGLKDSGTVEVGKRADLVLLSADPLADIRNTRKVQALFLGGRFLDRHHLDGLLSEARNRAK